MANQKTASLVRRGTNIEEFETTPFAHKYLLKKPRTHESEPVTRVTSRASLPGLGQDETHITYPAVEKRRFELFIDLIWVGIIGNLAGRFSDQAFNINGEGVSLGRSVFEFTILFLLAWRIWKFLQEFMSKYSTNDIIERAFVVWALVLATLYGNNAPYFLDEKDPSDLAVAIYLVFKASLFAIEAYYSLYLPQIRRRCILQTALGLPLLGLWIPAFYFNYPVKAGLAFAAVALEYWAAAIIETPMAQSFLKDDRKEILNIDHWVERIQDFYIIILGEGVLNLIKGSPLGRGITSQAGAGVSALLIFYVLSGLFFNGDCSRRYVHAVRRTWWRKVLWLSFHVLMFGCTLILGVSSAFLIQHSHTNAIVPDDSISDSEEYRLALAVRSAKWVVSATLSLVVFNQTIIALLNRSLDGQQTLKVSNRYLRLLPRGLVIAVAIGLPFARSLTTNLFLFVLVAMLIPCILWEWYASLERGGGILEP